MKFATYNRRSLTHFWRTNLSVALGAAVATATLTGALVVGDSMRSSLREAALGRLGTTDHAMVAPRMFRQSLADDLANDSTIKEQIETIAPVLLLRGSVKHADSGTRSNGVNIIGANASFWSLKRESDRAPNKLKGRNVVLNDALAEELGVKVGEDVLVQTGKPSAISTESLLGRRDDTTSTLRLTITDILPARGLAAFDLNPRQASPKNAFVPLAVLQRATDQKNRVNAILLDEQNNDESNSETFDTALARNLQLADLGLTLRIDTKHSYIALESDAMLIEPAIETAALAAAQEIGAETSLILTHLANAIRKNGGDTTIPYSTVAAINPASATANSFRMATGEMLMGNDDILLNAWAAKDLDAALGDTIELDYYITGPMGRLDTKTGSFQLRGILAPDGFATDPGFIPEYKGVTDTENLADWDPPFPVDLTLVRDKDEKYWDDYRTTPKAFISLAHGQELWANEPDRFGRITSIRITSPTSDAMTDDSSSRANEDSSSLAAEDSSSPLTKGGPQGGPRKSETTPAQQDLAERFTKAFLAKLDPATLGLSFDPVRKTIIEASKGSTDFGGLFIGFSFFLIASAALLVALLFRLSIEQRTAEIGLLLATGIPPRIITRQLILQGLWLSIIGAIVGTAGALGYAAIMLSGLRSIWATAVNTPFLTMSATPTSLAVGAVASVLVAAGAATLSIRTITCHSPRTLLAGKLETSPSQKSARGGKARPLAFGMGAIALALVGLSLTTDSIPPVAGFFASGSAALIAGLAALAHRLKTTSPRTIRVKGTAAMLKLAARNAPRHFARSVTTASLIASAAFLIVSLEAFRLHADDTGEDKRSGTGGFELYAEASTPLPYDLNTTGGREALGMEQVFAGTTITQFRLRPGDDSSCLNLYTPRDPRIVGAPPSMIERGGFRFGSPMQLDDADEDNPWTLLNHRFNDEAIPAIGDEAAVLWQLHLGLGQDLTIKDERGHDIKLRFVALLKGSALQDEIIIAEDRFKEIFPSIAGHAFFLIETHSDETASLESALERDLTAFSFDVASMNKRLADYNAVQNTYLSTFQALGGLGLILGTAGLAAVLLRNVWERRRELAIMRAIGFSRFAIATVVLAENIALVAAGLGIGTAAALVAILPPIVGNAQTIPVASLLLVILTAFAVSFIAGTIAVRQALYAPLVGSLRTE